MTEKTPADFFPTETEGLEEARPPQTVELRDGDHLELEVTPVRKAFGDAEVRMLAYNGSIPGPVLVVKEGSEIEVEAINRGDVATTVHWHGLRLDNAADGVPGDTQEPIQIGESFSCRIHFPDPGIYWYHPHLREDFAQEMGLYGTIIVEPRDESYWPPADRQLTITLDDVLIEHGKMVPFGRSGPTFTAMGRFGNTMLINGQIVFSEEATAGEVLRLHLVNTANTRIFNIAVTGGRMKLIGGDSGRYEKEQFVDEVLLSPSERITIDVLFDTPGEARLEHRTPDQTYDLGAFTVKDASSSEGSATAFEDLRVNPELSATRESIDEHLQREPDKVLSLVSEMPILYGDDQPEASSYVCPMHPEVTATEPEDCPKCGMKLVPAVPTSFVCPMHPEITADSAEDCPKCGMKLIPADKASDMGEGNGDGHEHGHGSGHHGDGLEWEDLMPDINRQTDTSNMIWQLVDEESGGINHEITWAFKVGDQVKIRLANGMDQEHPMHHPFHIHGAGRFLILSRDGEPEKNLVWKDTVLVRAGETVDILLDVTNPGRWMAHCHIAEHTESGMMFTFDVAPAPPGN
jgi:FtsP/CotA-like multicopper oxidase with cupredoxin domain